MKKYTSSLSLFIFGLSLLILTGFSSASPVHTVVKGDTLWNLSKEYNVTVKEIQEWNKLSSTVIYPGDELVTQSRDKGEKKTEKSTEMSVTATAYTAHCNGCSGTTATGINLRKNPKQKVVAVDPKVIPLGSRVWVEGYGEAIAGDTGGAIKGNKIDVFIPTKKEATKWGVKKVKLKVLS